MSATPSDGAAPRAGASVLTPLVRTTFIALIAVALAALLLAQHLKDERPLVGSAVWHPAGAPFYPDRGPALFSFTTGYTDRVTVSIVSQRTGEVLDVRYRNVLEHAGRRSQTFRWPARTAAGAPAPAGSYEVQIHFDRLNRTTILPSARFDLRAAR